MQLSHAFGRVRVLSDGRFSFREPVFQVEALELEPQQAWHCWSTETGAGVVGRSS
jgi:hypothetical protein